MRFHEYDPETDICMDAGIGRKPFASDSERCGGIRHDVRHASYDYLAYDLELEKRFGRRRYWHTQVRSIKQ